MKICPPALIYLAFTISHILIDTFKGLYNTAIMKFFVMIIITVLLNILCENNLSIISWLIVFIPFIMMSIISGLLLYIFGLDAATGNLKIECDSCNDNDIKVVNTYGKNVNNVRRNRVNNNRVNNIRIDNNNLPQTADEVNNYNYTTYKGSYAYES